MKDTTSSNQKVKIIQNFKHIPCILRLLDYAYNPFKQYHLTSSNLKKQSKTLLINKHVTTHDIFDLFDKLNDRKITGHNAIKEVNGFIEKYPSLKHIVLLVLDRNLKIRASTSLINKAVPGLIPCFNVALAQRFDENKFDNNKSSSWYISRKLDGVRCICIMEIGQPVKMFSRSGKEFHTLKPITSEIKEVFGKHVKESIVLDGEICILDSNDKDHFKEVMQEIRKKNHIVSSRCKFHVFDMISFDDFSRRKSDVILEQRLLNLQNLFQNYDLQHVRMVKQVQVNSSQHVKDFFNKGKHSKWEGIIIRKNTVYEGKRSWNMMKMKEFMEDEYDVLDIQSDHFRYIHKGKEYEKQMISNITISHKGNLIHVGSGFSIDERKYYHHHPSELLSSKVTVKYFEETTDSNGHVSSLRFPTIKSIHIGGKRID